MAIAKYLQNKLNNTCVYCIYVIYLNIIKNIEIMTATYTNKQTKENYQIGGVKGLEQAWNLAEFVCNRNNWNLEMFSYDVIVRVK